LTVESLVSVQKVVAQVLKEQGSGDEKCISKEQLSSGYMEVRYSIQFESIAK